MEPFIVFLGILFNFITATGIIFLNRYLFEAGFNYVVLLTLFHYATTWLGIVVCVIFGLVKTKPLSLGGLILFAVGFALGVPFCNASLQVNTVGTYQIMKALLSPVSVVIQTVWYNTKFSNGVLLSLVPICIGVAITGVTDIEITFMGVFYGLGCVFISVLTQIWAEEKQKLLDLNAMQLMFYTIPISSVTLLFVAPVTDDLSSGPEGFLNFEWNYYVVTLLVLTGAFAGVINITIYFILKELGPLTYQIYGHVKTCTILLGSFFLFGQPLATLNIIGMIVTMCGAFMYTYYKLNDSSPRPVITTPPNDHVINVAEDDGSEVDPDTSKSN